ncbi:MAG: xanthine dehydrogenase accessory protein XdhC [Rhodobacteraceae bacterium]|nr:xanthine dehydrogenase accessory protein XdhC [Paracoccaceae bacterium]
MGFDIGILRETVTRHGRLTRVVIAAVRGSSPREVGAAMLVWKDGQSGTIGGGTLEFEAAKAARNGVTGITQHSLGPDLGQCCGGAVTLLSECYDQETITALNDTVIARAVGATGAMPLTVKRLLSQARAQGIMPEATLQDGWMIEPVHQPTRAIWIWGAGHVGRALVNVLAPMPDVAITWVDTSLERFPDTVPDGVSVLPAARPAELVRHAPVNAEHLILTYSHALDLELCHRLLTHQFAFAGLIGSATKKARFRSRLAALGHTPDRIADITCPIGDPSLGKHPQMIAVGVGAALLRPATIAPQTKDLSA